MDQLDQAVTSIRINRLAQSSDEFGLIATGVTTYISTIAADVNDALWELHFAISTPRASLEECLLIALLETKANRSSIDPVTWGGYFRPACATNASAVTIRGTTFPEETLLMLGLRHSEQTQNGYHFHEVEWQLAVAPTWDQDYDDRGFNYLDIDIDTGDLILSPIVSGTPPLPVKAPWPLDGSGGALDDPTLDPAVLTFKAQPKMDFSIFNWTTGA